MSAIFAIKCYVHLPFFFALVFWLNKPICSIYACHVQVKSLTPLLFFVICFQWLGSIRSKSNYHLFSQMPFCFLLSILNEQNHLSNFAYHFQVKSLALLFFFGLICFQWLGLIRSKSNCQFYNQMSSAITFLIITFYLEWTKPIVQYLFSIFPIKWPTYYYSYFFIFFFF
jgi:hypothetical protein